MKYGCLYIYIFMPSFRFFFLHKLERLDMFIGTSTVERARKRDTDISAYLTYHIIFRFAWHETMFMKSWSYLTYASYMRVLVLTR